MAEFCVPDFLCTSAVRAGVADSLAVYKWIGLIKIKHVSNTSFLFTRL